MATPATLSATHTATTVSIWREMAGAAACGETPTAATIAGELDCDTGTARAALAVLAADGWAERVAGAWQPTHGHQAITAGKLGAWERIPRSQNRALARLGRAGARAAQVAVAVTAHEALQGEPITHALLGWMIDVSRSTIQRALALICRRSDLDGDRPEAAVPILTAAAAANPWAGLRHTAVARAGPAP